MGCRNDQHEHCDFDPRYGKGSISLDTNLMTLFPAHSNSPWFFLNALWLLFSSPFAFEMGRCSQSQHFQRGEHGSLNVFLAKVSCRRSQNHIILSLECPHCQDNRIRGSTSSCRVMLPKRALGALPPFWPMSNDTDQEAHSLHSSVFTK